jgi:hypothetical protein
VFCSLRSFFFNHSLLIDFTPIHLPNPWLWITLLSIFPMFTLNWSNLCSSVQIVEIARNFSQVFGISLNRSKSLSSLC